MIHIDSHVQLQIQDFMKVGALIYDMRDECGGMCGKGVSPLSHNKKNKIVF